MQKYDVYKEFKNNILPELNILNKLKCSFVSKFENEDICNVVFKLLDKCDLGIVIDTVLLKQYDEFRIFFLYNIKDKYFRSIDKANNMNILLNMFSPEKNEIAGKCYICKYNYILNKHCSITDYDIFNLIYDYYIVDIIMECNNKYNIIKGFNCAKTMYNLNISKIIKKQYLLSVINDKKYYYKLKNKYTLGYDDEHDILNMYNKSIDDTQVGFFEICNNNDIDFIKNCEC